MNKKRGRKLKALIILLAVAAALAGAGVVVRSVLLAEIRRQIAPSFGYDNLRLRAFPPSVVLSNLRSKTPDPFYSARSVVLEIPIRTILSNRRTFNVFVQGLTIRIYEKEQKDAKPLSLDFKLPFYVQNGLLLDGEVHYWGKGVNVLARGVRAYFRQSKDALVIKAEAASHAIHVREIAHKLEGRSEIHIEAREKEVFLRRLKIQHPDLLVKAKGTLTDLKNPALDVQATVRGPVALIADAFNLPFQWTGKAEATGRFVRSASGQSRFTAEVESRNMTFTGMRLGRVGGKLAITEGKGTLGLEISPPGSTVEYLDLAFTPGRLDGKARGLHVDPLIKQINIPWPVRSPIWGDFNLDLQDLELKGEFRDDLLPEENGRFPFRGPFRLGWDRKTGITFASERIESNFGAMRVDGRLDIGRDLRIEIEGEATDIPRGRRFTSLALNLPLAFPEIRGRGRVDVKILGAWHSPEVKIGFDLAPGGFAGFDVAEGSGLVEIAKRETYGTVDVRDPELSGKLRFHSIPGFYTCAVERGEGTLERIFSSLGLAVPLAGRVSGSLEFHDDGRGIASAGDFTSPRAEIAGQPVENVSGRYDWSTADNRLALTNLKGEIFGGMVSGSGSLGILSRDFAIDVSVKNVDLARPAPDVGGRLDFDLKGSGNLDRDPASGPMSIRNLTLGPLADTSVSGDIELTLREHQLGLRLKGLLNPGENTFDIKFRYPETEGTFAAEASGSLFNLDLVVPWQGTEGEIRYLAEARGGKDIPVSWDGVLDFKGPVLPFPKFAHAVTDYAGLIRIERNVATVRSFQGKLGGGDVFGSGQVRFGAGGLELVDLRAEGRDMTLSIFERTRALGNGSFRLLKNAREFILSGDVEVRDLIWRREITEKFTFSASPYPDMEKGKGPFDDLALDIRLRAEDGAVLENSLGKIEGRFDLTLSGTVTAPVVLGDLEGLKGEVYFQDRTFRLLRARLSFFNPTTIEPYLDFRGETYLKDFRVTFSLAGLMKSLRPEFVSSPPLPPEDVLALLALGESFKRTYSYDATAQVGTGSLMSFQLADQATRRAEQLFRLDRFRIDPFVLGASTEMTARLTVGKKISRNLILLYSTNLTSQREEIIRLEWEFLESFSLVGMRDERGRFSLDAKIRKRF
ncbi:MAG: translocation/assembly module TamB domain-containing protein [Candidatus Aminicenantes bacterium]|nr:translocation/assembly module TamB domain-containing protein [Candidatus Aminicenantes bacterium]